MKLHASGEDYLETILVLQKKLGMVRSVDVARHMESVKAQRVPCSGYLAGWRLSHNGRRSLSPFDRCGPRGGRKIYERHCFFTEQLIAAGVDPKTAEADACRIEHIISDESFSRLKEAAVMKELVRRQIQTVFALLSKKAQPPNSPRLAAGAKIVTM